MEATSACSGLVGSETRRSARTDLHQVTHSLIGEFLGRLPPGTVIRQIARAREQLIGVGVRAGLVPAVEAMARTRLCALVPSGARGGEDTAQPEWTTGSEPYDEVHDTTGEVGDTGELGGRIIRDLDALRLTLHAALAFAEEPGTTRILSAIADLSHVIASTRHLLDAVEVTTACYGQNLGEGGADGPSRPSRRRAAGNGTGGAAW